MKLMKSDRTKISDIAEALGVSAMTVSRALSGQYGVSQELRTRIIEKAKEMGYTKFKSNSDLNLLVLHQKPYLQDNSNYSLMIQGIERAIQKVGAGYQIEFVEKKKQDEMQLPLKLSKGNNFDGIIFVGGFNQEYVNFLKDKVKNQVLYTGYSPSYDYDSVWFNFNNGGYKQCEYLIKMGHKNIGFIGGRNPYKNQEKVMGITSALEYYGLPVRSEFFMYVDDSFEDKIMELLSKENRPTALICQWDYTAIRLIKMLHERGIRVPEDISVVGSGNTEMSSLCIPSLTTLDLNIDFSCETAVELLIRRINNPEKPNESILINSILIERDSVRRIG